MITLSIFAHTQVFDSCFQTRFFYSHKCTVFTQVVVLFIFQRETLFCTLKVLFLLFCFLFRVLCSLLIHFHTLTYQEWCTCFWELGCQRQNAVSENSRFGQQSEQDLPILEAEVSCITTPKLSGCYRMTGAHQSRREESKERNEG